LIQSGVYLTRLVAMGRPIGVVATKNTKRHENLCGLTGVESMPANAVFVTFCVFCGF
jgi:hypothetical protein